MEDVPMTGTDGISSLGKMLSSLNVNEARTTKTAATNALANNTLTGVLAGRLKQTGDHASVSLAGGLAASAAGQSDVRLAKVAQLQQAIASGNYKVAPSDVADKIVESLLSGR
jgi:negative regulator of flagellin synthesis FlgM